jgi:crotonobetainyl-CoA:carnitine CoA-transferase CaiB-like acyl-CoA transferase
MSALTGFRVLDLSRILAGPWCSQILADLGAEVIKIEKPFQGDDTRIWGPPFLKNDNGQDTSESAYYLSTNRGKHSVAIDMATAEGQALIKKMVLESDVLIENYKAGSLKKYGLDYESLSQLTQNSCIAQLLVLDKKAHVQQNPATILSFKAWVA